VRLRAGRPTQTLGPSEAVPETAVSEGAPWPPWITSNQHHTTELSQSRCRNQRPCVPQGHACTGQTDVRKACVTDACHRYVRYGKMCSHEQSIATNSPPLLFTSFIQSLYPSPKLAPSSDRVEEGAQPMSIMDVRDRKRSRHSRKQ
ncbi:unnamed protein product, partial [Boreogadus saida]